jgi:hypothetical protein
MEETSSIRFQPPVALTGEVIFESVHHAFNKKTLKQTVHRAIAEHLDEIRGEANWASYLVIFSPGQEYDEVRCQVDVETDGKRTAFAVGYGQHPNHAFSDAVERMQWLDRQEPIRMII